MNLNGGYAMIKYNSTQEELQIAYRSKRPALFYDENQRAHWAVIEETATESVDEETQEPITLYEYSYRLLDEESGSGSTLDNIVDSKGNKRFIEGNIELAVSHPNIWEKIYAKWSLSGTHLMIVGVLKNKDNFSNVPGGECFQLTLPDYIMNKIHAVFDANTVSIGSFWDGTDMKNSTLYKNKTAGKLTFGTTGQINTNATIRFQFDLLIDSE